MSLFNFNSLVFKLAATLTFTLWVINLVHWPRSAPSFTNISFLILSVAEVLLALFAHFPWYQRPYRGLGIEEHFGKMFAFGLIPFFIANLIFYVSGPSLVLNLVLSFLLLIVLIINLLLLSYHFRDPDKTPPAYFAANLYLKEKGTV